MSWEDNIYYHPDHYGLRVAAEWNEPNMSYEFHTFVIWEHEDGRFFWAEDSGCSCPSPFEDFNSLEDLETGPSHEAYARMQELEDQYGASGY